MRRGWIAVLVALCVLVVGLAGATSALGVRSRTARTNLDLTRDQLSEVRSELDAMAERLNDASEETSALRQALNDSTRSTNLLRDKYERARSSLRRAVSVLRLLAAYYGAGSYNVPSYTYDPIHCSTHSVGSYTYTDCY